MASKYKSKGNKEEKIKLKGKKSVSQIMNGVIEYVSQDVCHSPRDSYTDDILNLLNATKYRIESLNLEQTSEQSKSAELVNKNAKKLRGPETIEEVTGKEVEMHNIKEDEIEKVSSFFNQNQASKSTDAVVAENERNCDAEGGGLLLGIDSQTEQPRTQGEGNEKLVFIKCEDMSSLQSQNDKVIGGEYKMLQDMNKGQKQEGLLTSNDKNMIKKEARYLCGGCDYKSFDRDELTVHMENVHLNEDVRVIGIGCKPCEDGEVHPKCDFDKKYTLNQSLGALKDPLQFSCDACDHKSSKSRYMQIHISAVHLNEVKYSCNICNYKSFYFVNGKKHLRTHKDISAKWLPIKCKQCQTQVIHDKNALCLDENSKQIVIPEYKCVICDFKTSTKLHLKAHTKATHNKEVRYTCSMCNYKASHFQSLMSHTARIHKDTDASYRLIPCALCQAQKFHSECAQQDKILRHKANPENPSFKSNARVQTCPDCEYTTAKYFFMMRHKTLHHGDKSLPQQNILHCNHCEYETTTAHCLKRHNKLVHKENQENEKSVQTCTKCEYRTSKKRYMAKHIQLNHGEICISKEDIIHCWHCENETKSADSMKSHNQLLHKETDNGFRSCSKCDYKTSKCRYMFKHIHLNHSEKSLPQEKIFHCNDCEYETKTSKAMKTHNDMVHKKIVKFGCSKCSRTSLLMGDIKRHMRRRHKEAKVISFDCKLCVNRTNHLNCNTQLQSETGKGDLSKDVKCKTCNFFSDKKSKIKLHERVVHQKIKQSSCKMCDYKCFKNYSMRRHMNLKHSVGEAVKTYQTKKKRANENHNQANHDITHWKQHCKFCDFSSNKTGLRDHMNSFHPLEKLFKCNKCAYKCKWESNLKMHTRSKHEKVKVFCKECNYTSTWKVALLYHMRLKHGIFQRNTKYKKLLEFQESICENCGFAGTSKMSMKLHSKSGCDRWL